MEIDFLRIRQRFMWQLPAFSLLAWIFIQFLEHQNAGFQEAWNFYADDPVVIARSLAFMILFLGTWRIPLNRRFANEPYRNKLTAMLELGFVGGLMFRVLLPEIDPLTRTISFFVFGAMFGTMLTVTVRSRHFYRGEMLHLKSETEISHTMRVYIIAWLLIGFAMMTTSSLFAILVGCFFWTFAPTTHSRFGRVFETKDCRLGYAAVTGMGYFLLVYTMAKILESSA